MKVASGGLFSGYNWDKGIRVERLQFRGTPHVPGFRGFRHASKTGRSQPSTCESRVDLDEAALAVASLIGSTLCSALVPVKVMQFGIEPCFGCFFAVRHSMCGVFGC